MSTNLSRRRFIKGVIASGAAAASFSAAQFVNAAATASAGSVERLITLKVNGKKRRVDVMPQELLVDTLRSKLGMIGTKVSCNRGECGTCTVMVNDITHYACSTLTHSVRGRDVLTIEGVQAKDGTLHVVQQAFVDELAPQCGFCTPGQVISAVALLKVNPSPTRKEVQAAMSGNLCRCGAYEHYLNGVMRASAQLNNKENNKEAEA